MRVSPSCILSLLLLISFPRSAEAFFVFDLLFRFLCRFFGIFCIVPDEPTEAPATITPTPTNQPQTIVPSNRARHGLLVVADFADAKLEDYSNPLLPYAITNEQQIQDEILTPMEDHWEWMSLRRETFEWHILRITLDENLSCNAFSGWTSYRDAVAAKILHVLENDDTVDFESYDLDQDGSVDSCFVIASSHGQDCDYLIGGASQSGNVNMFVDPQGSQSLRGRHTGNFNHEVAHHFGLPDIYGSYDTIKYLTLMSDSWALPPNGFSAFERYRLGWLVPTRVKTTTQGMTLQPAEDAMESIMIPTLRDTEYFLIEYRKRTSSGFGSAASVPHNGLAIYHVWEDAPEENRKLPALIRLESPRGTYRWDTPPDLEDFWVPGSPDNRFMGVPYYDQSGDYVLVEVSNLQWIGGTSAIQMDISINTEEFLFTNYTSNPLQNGMFEVGTEEAGPSDWRAEAWQIADSIFSWDPTSGEGTSACGKIESLEPNDAAFVQSITGLEIGERYRVTASLKVLSISMGGSSTGATISLYGTWEHTEPINWVTDKWNEVVLVFVAQDETVDVSCRLGYWASTVAGTLLCDNFKIEWLL